MKIRNWQPRVEALESRWVPALLIQLDGSGNLTGIFGVPDGIVDVTFTADNEVNLVEAGNDLGTYEVTGNLSINLGNNALPLGESALNVTLSTFSLSGSLRILLGNALNGYEVNVSGDSLGGGVQGDFVLTSGNGDEVVTVTDLAVGGNVRVDTNGSFPVVANSDTALFTGVTFQGNTTVSDVEDFDSVAGTFEGNFTYTQSSNHDSVVTLDLASTVAGHATFRFGSGDDDLELAAAVLGNVVAQMGSGDNDWNPNLDSPANILGSLTYAGGGGIDTLNLDGLVAGNVTYTGRGGDDAVNFGSEAGLSVLGSSITLVMGNGADIYTNVDLTAPGARLTFLGGNGDDTVDWSAANPILLSAYLDGGFGANDFIPDGPITFPFTLRNFS